MAKLLFGTGGTPLSARSRSTVSGIERIAELGLGGMEIEFVHGVKMGEATARQVAQTASRLGVRLSAHAPYFVNLNASEPEKVRASQERILQTARIARICGAVSVVFHAAYYGGDTPQQTYQVVKGHLKEVLSQLRQEGNPVRIRPEVLGKVSEFGTVDEVLKLCTELEGMAPCIDFSHWHARTGSFNSYPEFAAVLKQVAEQLGRAALDDLHLHVSGIAYGPKGERGHLNLKESDFRYAELLQALKDQDASGMVICESHNLEEDALLLRDTYHRLGQAA